jgi:hypothetical protein
MTENRCTQQECHLNQARRQFSLLWAAVFLAWLATGAVFLLGTYRSQEIDQNIITRMDLIERGINACILNSSDDTE